MFGIERLLEYKVIIQGEKFESRVCRAGLCKVIPDGHHITETGGTMASEIVNQTEERLKIAQS